MQRARGLPVRDSGLLRRGPASSDPYVTLRMGNGPVRQTSVVRRSLSPEWAGEAFFFVPGPEEPAWDNERCEARPFLHYHTVH